MDGGVIDNIPVFRRREKGADIVIAVDISENVLNFNITNLLDVMLRSITIMGAGQIQEKRMNVLISPKVGDVNAGLYPEETVHDGRHRGYTEDDAGDQGEDRGVGRKKGGASEKSEVIS